MFSLLSVACPNTVIDKKSHDPDNMSAIPRAGVIDTRAPDSSTLTFMLRDAPVAVHSLIFSEFWKGWRPLRKYSSFSEAPEMLW